MKYKCKECGYESDHGLTHYVKCSLRNIPPTEAKCPYHCSHCQRLDEGLIAEVKIEPDEAKDWQEELEQWCDDFMADKSVRSARYNKTSFVELRKFISSQKVKWERAERERLVKEIEEVYAINKDELKMKQQILDLINSSK